MNTITPDTIEKKGETATGGSLFEIDFNTVGYAGANGLTARIYSESGGNTDVGYTNSFNQFGAMSDNTVYCENSPMHCDLQLQALLNGSNVASANYSINCLTGSISGNTTAEQTSVFFQQNGTSYVMNYGVSHAGNTTIASMGDQAYCYVSTAKQSWMGSLNLAGSNPLVSTLVLPGAHDAGMSTIDPHVLQAGTLLTAVIHAFPVIGQILALGAAVSLKRVLYSLAVTQKDSPADLMNMGVRFFDFRPGTVSLTNEVRHVHGVIPGQLFSDFLTQVASFLSANPTEVVFVQVSSSGINDSIATPLTIAQVNSAVQTAINGTSVGTQTIGDTGVLNSTTWNQLVSAGRLVVLNKYDSAYIVNDSYSDGVYQQSMCDPSFVANAIQNTIPQISSSCMTSLQCQNTASGFVVNNIGSFLTSPSWVNDLFLSDTGSVLADTKAIFDYSAYSLLSSPANQYQIQQSEGIVSVINDFGDIALVDLCMSLTQARLLHANFAANTKLALLLNGWRTMSELNTMSADDMRNTLIVELNKASTDTIPSLQGRNDTQLTWHAIMYYFLLDEGHTAASLAQMSLDDQRNTMITILNIEYPGIDGKQGFDNGSLINLLISGTITPNGGSEICADAFLALLINNWRTLGELNGMLYDDRRNTLIVGLSKASTDTITSLQGMTDEQLTWHGIMYYCLIALGNTAASLAQMSLDDHRNTMITILNTLYPGYQGNLQSLSNSGLVNLLISGS